MEPVINISVVKVNGNLADPCDDNVAAEEPLEIRLNYQTPTGRKVKSISVTMRTPGNDADLATGFLYTEGIVRHASDINAIAHVSEEKENVVVVRLCDNVVPDLGKLERNFYTTSSCGVCGKSSIEAVRTECEIIDTKDSIVIQPVVLCALPDKLRNSQKMFESTGAIHACSLFDPNGNLIMLMEDVGRHNALDKLLGASLMAGMVPVNQHILLLSGRASFELIQKAAMAGIKIVAAVGAPSSLAVQMAEEWGMTLVGFLRGTRFNIYTGAQRIATTYPT